MKTGIDRKTNSFSSLRILLVEESEHDFLALCRAFKRSRAASEIIRYVRAEDALLRIEADSIPFDLVVTEYKLSGMSGLEFCKELIDRKFSLPRVLLTGAKCERLALEALKKGFDDYLIKESYQGYPDLLPVIFPHVVQKHRYRQSIKRAEEESKTQAPQNDIKENMTEMVCRFLYDTTLTYINDACCRYFSAEREDLLGLSFMRFIHKEDHEALKKHLASLSLEDPVGKMQCRVLLPAGEIRWQEWTNRAIFDGQSCLAEFQSVGLDISKCKQAQDDLHLSEDRYHYLVESVLDGFFICEITSGNFLVINKKACDLFGYPMQEALTLSIWDMIARGESETIKEDIRARLNREATSPFCSACKVLCKDGSEFKAELSASIVSFQGEQALQGIIRDISEQEGLQQKLAEVYKLEGVSTLACGIAHQFYNVLAEITGEIGRLESDFPEDENINKYVEPMYDATQRMSHLNRQLFSCAGGEKYQPEIISLNELVEEILVLVGHTIDPAIQVETVLADNVFNVEADAALVQLKLAALMTTTAGAIEGPGRIKIITKNEEIEDEFAKKQPKMRPGRYVCLTVEADGKGLDERTKRTLIEPFLSTSSEERSLGVAVVADIEEEHGDWMTVDAYFSVSESKKTASEKEKTELPNNTNGTILIVEDEEAEEGITRAILEKLGYYVLEVKTGMEAINLARAFDGEIDLAFLDIVLPDMGCEELYALLMEALPNLKVILCSGYSNDTLVQKVLDEGAQAFIQKPFTVATVSEKLEEVLEGKP